MKWVNQVGGYCQVGQEGRTDRFGLEGSKSIPMTSTVSEVTKVGIRLLGQLKITGDVLMVMLI